MRTGDYMRPWSRRSTCRVWGSRGMEEGYGRHKADANVRCRSKGAERRRERAQVPRSSRCPVSSSDETGPVVHWVRLNRALSEDDCRRRRISEATLVVSRRRYCNGNILAKENIHWRIWDTDCSMDRSYRILWSTTWNGMSNIAVPTSLSYCVVVSKFQV